MKKITRKQYDKAVCVIKAYKAQLEEEITEAPPLYSKDTLLYDVKELSVRLLNVLRNFNWYGEAWGKDLRCVTISDLAKFSESDYLRARGMGHGALRELRKIMAYAGINLK